MSRPAAARRKIRSLVRSYLSATRPKMKPRSLPLTVNGFGADEVNEAIDSLLDLRTTMGPKVLRFEKAWTRYQKSAGSIMVNSGSSANLVAVAALLDPSGPRCLRPGDEVIVPAVTWSTTIFPLQQLGLVPVLVDVDPETLNLTPDGVEAAITRKTRGIVPVHLLGNPCPMPEIMSSRGGAGSPSSRTAARRTARRSATASSGTSAISGRSASSSRTTSRRWRAG